MKLYKIEVSNWETFFGTPRDLIDRDAIIIAQTPNCDAFLLLSKTEHNEKEVELLDTAPSGFDFTYCQEWGLEVNDAKIDRVIADLN
jgi:DNA helicase TIP49 (TBP-interacting protein)